MTGAPPVFGQSDQTLRIHVMGPTPACRKFLSPRRREDATFMEITLVVRIADLGIANDIKPPLEAISGVGS